MNESPEQRLSRLGLELPAAPQPSAAFAPTVQIGDLLFASGQIAQSKGVLVATGRIGNELDVGAGQECARQCALNLIAQLVALPLGSPVEIEAIVEVSGSRKPRQAR